MKLKISVLFVFYQASFKIETFQCKHRRTHRALAHQSESPAVSSGQRQQKHPLIDSILTDPKSGLKHRCKRFRDFLQFAYLRIDFAFVTLETITKFGKAFAFEVYRESQCRSMPSARFSGQNMAWNRKNCKLFIWVIRNWFGTEWGWAHSADHGAIEPNARSSGSNERMLSAFYRKIRFTAPWTGPCAVHLQKKT